MPDSNLSFEELLQRTGIEPAPGQTGSGLSFEDLLKQTGVEPVQQQKLAPDVQAQVEQQALGNDFYGIAAIPSDERDPSQMSEDERLLRAGDAVGLERKYGSQLAAEMLRQSNLARAQVMRDEASTRTGTQAVYETTGALSEGMVGGVMNLATLLGKGTDSVGLTDGSAQRLASATRQINEKYHETDSDATRAHQRLAQIRTGALEQSNAANAERSLRNEGPEHGFEITVGRMVADAVGKAKIIAEDPIALTSGSAAAVGSMLLSAGAGKSLSAIGEGALAIGAKKVSEKALERVALGGFMAASAFSEGGGAYQQGSDAVMSKSVGSLYQTSQPFADKVAELVKSGVPQPEAEVQAQAYVADQVGTTAALWAMPTAALFAIPAKGSANLGHVEEGLLKEVLGETAEETAVNMAAQFGQNLGLRNQVDPKQDLYEGVGSSGGEGGLFGALSAGGMKAPGSVLGVGHAANDARQRLIKTSQEQGTALSRGLVAQADTLQADADNKAKLNEAFKKIVYTGSEEHKLANELMDSPTVSALPGTHAILSPENQAKFAAGQNRVQAIQEASKAVLSEKDPGEKQALALFLTDLMEPVRKFQETPAELSDLMAHPETGESLQAYQKVLTGITQIPVVQKAMAEASKVFAQQAESIDSMPGEQAAKVLGSLAQVDPNLPASVSSAQVERILKAEPRSLTPEQRTALKGSLELIRVREAVLKQQGPASQDKLVEKHFGGAAKTAHEVTTQVLDPESGKYSARQHTKRIVDAMASGNVSLAQGYAGDLADFVQHMQNKVRALNSSQTSGKDVVYQQLTVDRETGARAWLPSDTNPNSKYKKAFFNPKIANSLAHAQEVDAEAHMLFGILQGLGKAYPELGIKPAQEVRINKLTRTGTVQEVAEKMAAKPKVTEKIVEKATTVKPGELREQASKLSDKELHGIVDSLMEKKDQARNKQSPSLTAKEETTFKILDEELSVRETTAAKAQEEVPAPIVAEKPAKNEVKQPKNEVKAVKAEPKPKSVKEAVESTLKRVFGALDRKGKTRLYFTDQATGLLNNKGAEVAPRDPKRPFLAIFSLEGKKFLNDEHKHTAFDGALRVMARTLVQSGIKDGMKVGGDVQAFVQDQAHANKIAEAMSKQFPGFQVVAGGADIALSTKIDNAAFKTAYKGLDAKMKALRDVGEVAPRKAPPQAFMKGAPAIKWEDDGTGHDLKSKEARSFIGSVAKATAEFGAKMRSETQAQRLEMPAEFEAHLKALGITDEQIHQTAFYEPNTGLLTLQGWETVYPELLKLGYSFASLDLRALKPMNDKDSGFGEAGADKVLHLFGQTIREIATGMGTWLHGDEFAMAFLDPEEAKAIMQAFEAVLSEKKIYREIGDVANGGELVHMTGLQAAWGVGSDFDKAESDLATRKEIHDAHNSIQAPVVLTGDTAVAKLAELRSNGAQLVDRSERPAGRQEARAGDTGASSKNPSQSAEAQPAVAETKAAPKTIAELYPKVGQLSAKVLGFFQKAYKIARAPEGKLPTRVMGSGDPVKVVSDAINSKDEFRALLGKDSKGKQIEPRGNLSESVQKAYQDLLAVHDNLAEFTRAWKREFQKKNAHLKGKPRWAEYKLPAVVPGTQSVGGVMAMAHSNLQDFMQSEFRKGVSFQQAIEQGLVDPTLWLNGKALSVVEKAENGGYRYNPELLRAASLAALHWQINASQRQVNLKEDDVADDLEKDLNLGGQLQGQTLNAELVRQMSQGENLSQAKKSLSDTIKRFWGVQPDDSQPMGVSEAIHEAMAAEMLRSMMNLQLVKVVEVNVHDLQPELDITKTVDRYVSKDWNEGETKSPLYDYPSLLEEAVVVEPEHKTFYSSSETVKEQDERPKVSKSQLRNDKIELTDEQKTAVKNVQEQKFTLNMPMVKALLSMSNEAVVKLFGVDLPVDPKEREAKYNRKHLASLEGQNASVLSGIRELRNTFAEMQNVADARGIKVEDLGKRYQYAVTSMNRIMMLGAQNPQANKLMREALLPTWSTLDLSDEGGEHMQLMAQALAQALERKVHWFAPQENISWLDDKLNELSEARSVIQSWLADDSKPFPAEAFKAAVGDKASVTPLMKMALIEHERFVRASPAERKAFRTPLYLESDGMTNGPFNAIGLLSVGSFTEAQLTAMARGGLAVGQGPKTSDQLRAENGWKDLYKAAVDRTQVQITEQGRAIRAQKDKSGAQVAVVRTQLIRAMAHLLDDVKLKQGENGSWSLELERGIGKNPMTIMIYGSSTNGIAGKLLTQLEEALYARLSESAQTGKPLPQELRDAVDTVTATQAGLSKKGRYFIHDGSSQSAALDRLAQPNGLQEFAFTPEERNRLRGNLHELFVKPMKQGVEDVIGPTIFKTTQTLIEATKLQSVVARELFVRAIENKLAEKREDLVTALRAAGVDPADAAKMAAGPNASEFLSRDELDAIWTDLGDVMPEIDIDGQRFHIAKDDLLRLGANGLNSQYSRSLDSTMRTAPYVTGVQNAGVSAVPYMTIGMGDARMVRKLFSDLFDRVMQVYDGVNIPIDRVNEYGSRINKAALEAWQGDIFGKTSLMFERFLHDDRANAMITELTQNGVFEKEKIDPNNIVPTSLLLKRYALEQEARRNVLSRYQVSIDQMSGTYHPHVTEGLTVPEGSTHAQVAEILSVEYAKELQRLQEAQAAKAGKVQERIAPKIKKAVKPGPTTVGELLQSVKLEGTQRELVSNLVKSGALRGVRVVVGDLETLIKHQIEKYGRSSIGENLTDTTIGGVYSPEENTVYIKDATPEVVAHELVHAATYRAVEAHYSGIKMGTETVHVRAAVGRLEQLMHAFLGETAETGDILLDAANAKVREVVQSQLAVGDAVSKAMALNEFMAWSLANQKIAESLSKQSLFEKFKKLAKATVQAVARLLWRTENPTPKQLSVLQGVQFNTELIAHAQSKFSLTEQLQGVLLAHETIEGSDDTRLGRLMEAFTRKVAGHLDYGPSDELSRLQRVTGVEDYKRQVDELTFAADYLFPMSMQEQQVFHMMVSGLATQHQVSPHTMIEAQRIFNHLLKDLTHDDLLTGHRNEQYDRDQAKDKFEFLAGHTVQAEDGIGRSSMLPVFMALASVSEDFRKVLAKKSMPKVGRDPVTGVDSAIDAAASRAMTALENILSGLKQPENTRVAVDQLMEKLTEQTLRSQSAIQDKIAASGKLVDRANDVMVGLLQRAGEKTGDAGRKLRESGSHFQKAIGVALQAVSFLSSEEQANVIQEGVLSFMDKHPDTWQWVKDVVSDMVGRVASQGWLYDLAKRAKALSNQTRQKFRDNVPAIIMKQFKSSKPTPAHMDSFYTVMGRYDMASLIGNGRDAAQVLALATDSASLAQEVSRLENQLQVAHPHQAAQYLSKVAQLAKFIQTGERGPVLLRNARAIADLVGTAKDENWTDPTPATVQAIDELVTLRLLDRAATADMKALLEFSRSEPEAMQFMLSYLKGQRATELTKVEGGPARYNHYKGELPSDHSDGGHMTVEDDSKHELMTQRGYKKVGVYKGSSIDRGGVPQSYYFSPSSGAKATFNQGIAQSIQVTAYGVNSRTGYSLGPTAGVITDPVRVRELARKMHKEHSGPENLSPVFGEDGAVVAFERSMDPRHLRAVERPQNLAAMLGRWRGRQVEEVWGSKINQDLVDELHRAYKADLDVPGAEARYENVYESEDPVVRDAVSIFPYELRKMAEAKFGRGKFMVRRNLVNQVVGYRSASVTDLWTGNSRWSESFRGVLKSGLTHLLGDDAYRVLQKAEQNWQGTMSSVRTNIVVRSLVVPAANFVSGLAQLKARGVGLGAIAKGVPSKVVEIEQYTKTMRDLVEIEAQKWAHAGDVFKVRALEASEQSMKDGLKNLSIWPLIDAGEFSSIADVGQTAESLEVGPKNVMDKLSEAVDKLPPGLRDAAKLGYMARDTALFQVLQKSAQYSDFVMKAIYFDHLTGQKRMTHDAARALVTEEFVNFDMPTGRVRGFLENMGLMWFMNYKLRINKIALSMARNNPFHLLVFAAMPHPPGADIPLTGNFLSKLFDGVLGFSFGPRMMMQAISVNPWYNLLFGSNY